MSQRIEMEVDDLGRLVLPSAVGYQLGLAPGTTLVVEQQDDSESLRLVRDEPRLVDRGGVLVVETGPIQWPSDPVQDLRDQRLDALAETTFGGSTRRWLGG